MAHAASPSLQSLVDETLAHVPALSHAVYNGLQDELKSRLEHHQLLAGWSKRRAHFASDLEGSLGRLLSLAREGGDPLQRERQAAGRGELSLSLVDEGQALKDVAIAHVITAIEDQSRAELHQLGNFFAALRGIARPLKNDNPLRAALFAQALSRAIEGVDLDAEGRYALMRMAALPLALKLQPIYASLCQGLRQAQLSGMLTSHGAALKESDLRRRQFKSITETPTQNATLDQVALKLDLMNTRAAELTPAMAHPGPAGAAPAAPPPRLGPGTGASGTDLLSRLYDQILADDSLQPPLKVLMGRLQVAIVRLSRADATLLRRQDHPTWQLLNRIAAHGAGFQRPDDVDLKAFLQFLERVIQPLLDSAHPSALQFQQALTEVDSHIRAQAEARGQRSAVALERLDREQRRQEWQRMLRDQLEHQLDDAQAGKLMRRFLLGPWVEVIAHAMVQHGRDAVEAQTSIELVDALLHSVSPQPDEAARQRLRSQLPDLVRALERGMDSIALPPMQRQTFLDELMRQHGRVLRGLPALEEAAPAAPAAPSPRRPARTPEELLQQLLDERESQLPSRWAYERVDRGQLPTVPVALYSEEHSPHAQAALQDWIAGVHIGGWYHLFHRSEWITAQIAWISDSRQMFLFIGQAPEERHSVTRGALEQLVAAGLITQLEDAPLLQRAIGTLMLDLDRAPAQGDDR